MVSIIVLRKSAASLPVSMIFVLNASAMVIYFVFMDNIVSVSLFHISLCSVWVRLVSGFFQRAFALQSQITR